MHNNTKHFYDQVLPSQYQLITNLIFSKFPTLKLNMKLQNFITVPYAQV